MNTEPKPQPGDRERIDAELRKLWAAFDDWTEQEQGLARTVWLHAEHATRGKQLQQWLGDPANYSPRGVVVVDPTDPGHDVEVLREHVRHLERRIRELHAERAAGVEASH